MSSRFGVRLSALFVLAVLSCLVLACGSESVPAPQVAATTAPATLTTVPVESPVTVKFPSPFVPTPMPTAVPPTAKADAAPSPEKKARLVKVLGDRYKDTTTPPIITQDEALKALLKQPSMVFNLETKLDKMTAFYGLFENREV